MQQWDVSGVVELGVGRSSRLTVAVLLTAAAASGYDPALTPRAVDDAIALGQSRIDSVRLRFHLPYRLQVARPPIDYIEIVTPFRRIELAAEERTRTGDTLLRQREALSALARQRDDLELFVDMTFHPLNTYAAMPSYEVHLAWREPAERIEAADVRRLPRYSPRVDGGSLPSPYPVPPGFPGGGQPLVGGTLISRFDSRTLSSSGVYDVVVEDSGKELARARVNLGSLR